jgi:hypothetical protein
MLDLNKCQLIETRVEKLSTTVSSIEEGVPMVHILENGAAAAIPCTGAANEGFIGFTIQRSQTPTNVPLVEQLVIPTGAPYTITLSKALFGTAIGVAVINTDGSRTILGAGTPASNAPDYSISGQVITVNSAQAGKTLEISYRYAISLAEAMLKWAFNAFAPATFVLDNIGLCDVGEIYTDRFDPASNWAGWTLGTPVKLAAGGIVSLGGSGGNIPCYVSSVPGVNSPLLGLRVLGPGAL